MLFFIDFQFRIGTYKVRFQVVPLFQLVDGYVIFSGNRGQCFSLLDFMIESSVAIDDSILQHELNSTSDEKMKGIVATIQREQNKIIRNDKTKTLLIP